MAVERQGLSHSRPLPYTPQARPGAGACAVQVGRVCCRVSGQLNRPPRSPAGRTGGRGTSPRLPARELPPPSLPRLLSATGRLAAGKRAPQSTVATGARLSVRLSLHTPCPGQLQARPARRPFTWAAAGPAGPSEARQRTRTETPHLRAAATGGAGGAADSRGDRGRGQPPPAPQPDDGGVVVVWGRGVRRSAARPRRSRRSLSAAAARLTDRRAGQPRAEP